MYWFANDPVDSVMKRKNISQSFFPPILFFKKRYVHSSYNRDRTNQRKLGKSAPRGTHTCLAVHGGFGCHIHTNHYQVAPDHVRVSLSNLNAPTVKSITQASRALLGAGNTRSLALEAGQTNGSISQMQYLLRQAVELPNGSFFLMVKHW